MPSPGSGVSRPAPEERTHVPSGRFAALYRQDMADVLIAVVLHFRVLKKPDETLSLVAGQDLRLAP